MRALYPSIKSVALSHTGYVRKENEDAFGVLEHPALFAIADGLGGMNHGKLAAHKVIDLLLLEAKKSPDLSIKTLKKIILEINQKLFETGMAEPALKGFSSTLIVALFDKNTCYFISVGDSRLYRFRQNTLTQLTLDDSLLSELLQLNLVKPEEAKLFPLKHIITRSIGLKKSLLIPSCGSEKTKGGDIYLLCSDGLWNLVDPLEVEQILRTSLSLEEKGEALLSLALKKGGTDNITLILITL